MEAKLPASIASHTTRSVSCPSTLFAPSIETRNLVPARRILITITIPSIPTFDLDLFANLNRVVNCHIGKLSDRARLLPMIHHHALLSCC
jgi:hypothetical protein